jgi:hypothetical protein
MPNHKPYDALIVGGGHNGLTCACYLAAAGLKVRVLERRSIVGGAAVTEEFFPGFRNSTAAYTVSLLHPKVIRDLKLAEHGLHVYPQGPYFAPRRDGRYLRLPDDPAARFAEIAKFDARDAEAYVEWDAWLAGLGKLVGPLLEKSPVGPDSLREQLVDQADDPDMPAGERGQVVHRGERPPDLSPILIGSLEPASRLPHHLKQPDPAPLGIRSKPVVEIGRQHPPREKGNPHRITRGGDQPQRRYEIANHLIVGERSTLGQATGNAIANETRFERLADIVLPVEDGEVAPS